MIRFACSKCMTIHEVEDGLAGAEIYCRKCNSGINVPSTKEPSYDAIEIADNIRPPAPRPDISKPDQQLDPVGLLIWGLILFIAGGMTLLWFVAYDTTVPGGGLLGTERIHNTGLMNNRVVGIACGGIAVVTGAILTGAYFAARK